MLTSRERVALALSHQEADRVPVDLGGSPTTGMQASAVYQLRQALKLDPPGTAGQGRRAVQMLGEIKPDLMNAMGLDVVGSARRGPCSVSRTRAGSRGPLPTARRCWCPRHLTPSGANGDIPDVS